MRGNKDFRKGGKLVQGVGALKWGGLEPPYELREGGWGRGDGLSESIKKGKFVTKIFLSDVE